MNDLLDVLSYGPIIYPCFNDTRDARDFGFDCFVTINGTYLNFWTGSSDDGWTNTDCRYVGDNVGSWTLDQIIEKAKSYYEDSLETGDEEEEED